MQVDIPSHPIVGVLECSSKYKYGISSHGTPLYIFHPLNENIPCMLVGSKIKEIKINYLALVSYANWEGKFPKGNLIEIFGECGIKDIEVKAISWLYNPYQKLTSNSKKIWEYNTEIKKCDSIEDWKTFNIDPTGCEDIDDCISYKIDSCFINIGISIANVSSVITLNSEIDNNAKLIGQTLYSNNTRYSMLPREVEKRCSLNLGEKRNCLTMFFKYNTDNKEISNISFKETIIVNKNTYDYDSIYDSTEKDIINFMKEYSKSEDSHKWIESLMIFYNQEAAKILKTHNQGIFRRHSKPQEEKLELYKKYNEFLAYESAEYCPCENELYHYGLNEKYGVNEYIHMTSPIRRYADLYNQRIFIESIETESNIELIKNLNIRSKEIKRHDRDLFFINIIFETSNHNLDCSIIHIGDDKLTLYCEKWNRVIKIKMSYDSIEELKIDDKISLRYFINPKEKLWKKRIIFEIKK
jgi:exoribonuclease R